MKVIITVGCANSGYDTVFGMLNQTGIAKAQPGRISGLSPQALQSRLINAQEIDLHGTDLFTQAQPGKLWNEVATDLFLTNIQHPLWGWADDQSIVLMDFWQDFDPQVRLLLVYNAPEVFLQHTLQQSAQTQHSAQSINKALDQWQQWNTALLRYFHRHQDRCILVNSEQVSIQPMVLLDILSDKWQITGLDLSRIAAPKAHKHPHLQAHLIRQIISDQHPVWSLNQELNGAAMLPFEDAQAASSVSLAWADWADAQSSLAVAQTQLDALNNEMAEAAKARAQLGTQIAAETKAKVEALAQRDQAAKDNTALIQQRDALQAEKNTLNQQLEQLDARLAQAATANLEVTELKQENELLLLQLHQEQEELESHFLKNQALSQVSEQLDQLKKDLIALQAQRDALAKERAELVKGRDTQAKLLQERQTQLELAAKTQEAAVKAKEQQSKLVADLQLAVAALQSQKEQLTKEKSTLSHAKAAETKAKVEAFAQRDQAAKDKTAPTQQRDALQAEKTNLHHQLEQLQAQLKQATTASAQANQASLEVTELKQENELLLLQLHQVQEELEHYFLRHQELEKSQNSKAVGFVTDFWRMHQPQELVISMQQNIAGSNWYPAESDGRWAGPATLSTLQMPPVQPGNYTLELDIVDAMNLDIVNSLVVEALGQTMPVEVFYPLYKGEYPLICKVQLRVSDSATQQAWPLNLRFSQTVCPADNGFDDMRNLSVRLRTLKLVKQA